MTSGSANFTDPSGKKEKVPTFCSKRWTLAYVGVFGFFFCYAMRVNMSVGIVCMVRSANTTTNTTLNSSTNHGDSKCAEESSEENDDSHAEFDWDKSTQGLILSSFFYGYIVMQIPAGWLASRFGGKRVLGAGLLITAAMTLLIPVGARWDYRAVIAIRVVQGLAESVSFPAMHSMWGRWAPPLERSRLASFTYMGLNFGNIVTYMVSGVLCTHGFDNGWPSIFYIIGGACFVWVLVWFLVVEDTPEKHPTISQEELDYIVSLRGKETEKFHVPWLSVVKSRALWVCLTAHLCNNWMHYTLLTGLPTFMKEVLKFNIENNGVLSAVPYMVMIVTMVSAGILADLVRSRWLSTTYTRRIFQSVSFLGAGGCLVGVGFVSCEHRELAVALLAVAVGFEGLCYAGYMVNQVDFAPRYAGLMMGVTNTFATIPGMVAPSVIGALTPNKTQEEWKHVFYICGALTVLGTIVFGGFASGEVEPWAVDISERIVHEPTKDKKKEEEAHFNSGFTETKFSGETGSFGKGSKKAEVSYGSTKSME